MAERLDKPDYIYTSQEILDLGITEIPMLIDNLLPKKGMAALSGGSDGGKSFLVLFLACVICGNEKEIFGLPINRKHGSVIIVCTEDSAEDISVRLSGLLKNRQIANETLRFIFDTENLTSKLTDELKRKPADLVIIDTLGDLFSGNLNDSITVRQFLKPYKTIASRCNCLFLFNHHIGKGKENNATPSKNDVLGSQGIESACRTVLMLRKKSDGIRELTMVKGNHFPEELKNKGLLLKFDPKTGFEPTGETIHFSGSSFNNQKDDLLEQEVQTLYPILKSYKKVSDALRKKGHRIDKNKVGQIWKSLNPPIPPPIENDGRTETKPIS